MCSGTYHECHAGDGVSPQPGLQWLKALQSQEILSHVQRKLNLTEGKWSRSRKTQAGTAARTELTRIIHRLLKATVSHHSEALEHAIIHYRYLTERAFRSP